MTKEEMRGLIISIRAGLPRVGDSQNNLFSIENGRYPTSFLLSIENMISLKSKF